MINAKDYLVWDPERETEDEAGTYEALGVDAAARKYITDHDDGATYYQLLAKDDLGTYEVVVSIIEVPEYRIWITKV